VRTECCEIRGKPVWGEHPSLCAPPIPVFNRVQSKHVQVENGGKLELLYALTPAQWLPKPARVSFPSVDVRFAELWSPCGERGDVASRIRFRLWLQSPVTVHPVEKWCRPCLCAAVLRMQFRTVRICG